MKWPGKTKFTEIQAEEAGKLFLNLCQATIIGMVGAAFVPNFTLSFKIILVLAGFLTAVILFLIGMRFLREVKRR